MRLAPLIGCTLTLAGCAAGPDFKPPAAEVPAHWSNPAPGSHSDERDADLQRWWTSFNDPTLSSLIDRALAANLDLRVAVLRIEESRAQRAVTTASLWPSLSANASYTRTRLSDTTPTGALFTTFDHVSIPGVTGIQIPNPYNQYQLGAQASWEFDLFGRLRRSVEAADANLAASVADQHAATVSLLGDVARGYLDLRGAQRSAAIARQSIATTGELLELSTQRRAAGLTSEVDVVEAGAELSATEAQLPTYDLQISQDIHQLSRLLGREPEALRAELATAADLPAVPHDVPIGLPAALARRRPDILEAEAELHAATAQIGVAVADLFPRVTLTGAGGLQSQTSGELTEWASRFFAVGPTLELPVFDRGRWQTVSLQRVREKEAAVRYANTVLNALQEVENARAAYDADQDRHTWLEKAVAQDLDAVELTRERYRTGVASFIEVLDAERTLQQNQQSLAQNETAVGQDLVTLYRTLGGGWQSAAASGA